MEHASKATTPADPGPPTMATPVSPASVAPATAVFPIVVPDFVNWDAKAVAPTPPPALRDRRGRARRPAFVPKMMKLGFAWLGLVTQRLNEVTVPAAALGSALWGADRATWPRNWVRALGLFSPPRPGPGQSRAERAAQTRARRAKARAVFMTCPPHCPLHGTPRHHHAVYTLPAGALGQVARLACGTNPDGSVRFDLRNAYTADEADALRAELAADITARKAHLADVRDSADADELAAFERELGEVKRRLARVREGGRKVDGLRPVYLPGRVLATSPRLGLTPCQHNLVAALTRELTRDPRRNGRPDQAAVVAGGAAGACPLLAAGGSYVALNGNGAGSRAHLRGHGYKPAAWAKKAAYPAATPVADLVADLAVVGGVLGLVVAGYAPASGRWLDAAELRAAAGTAAGVKRLAGCLIRVYTAADYLVRWRAAFAAALGFARIPARADELPGAGAVAVAGSLAAVATGPELAAWMRRVGLTDAALAGRLGVSRAYVARCRASTRPLGPAFRARLSAPPTE